LPGRRAAASIAQGVGRQEAATTAIGEIVGRGAVADIHVYGTHVLKLYHADRPKADAFVEASLMAIVGMHRLPMPQVHEVGRHGGRWGLVMDRALGSTLGERALADPALMPACLDEMVRLHLLLHAITETRLRPLKSKVAANISRTPLLAAPLKQRLLERLAALPDGDRLCHGDFHPLNLMGEPGNCLIVDWLDASCGPPAADACRSYLLLRQGAPGGIADAYLARYAAAGGMSTGDILAWLPCMAAARLTEGMVAEEASLLALAGTV
jgi:hypothetical protein